MEFGRAFSYITEDPDWLKKLAITGLITFIPFIGSIAVMGWMIEIVRRVIAGEAEVLPAWNDFSGLITKGFKAFAVTLAYTLPIIVLSSCAQFIVPFMVEGGNQEALTAVLSLFTICLSCLLIIFSLGISLILPASLGILAATGEVGAAFRFNDIIGLVRAAPGPYLLAIVGSMAASFISSAGVFLCFVGIIITAPFGMAIYGHLYGQAYLTAKAAQALNA